MVAVVAVLLFQAGIDWKTDYKAALADAQKDGRYVVVYFNGPNCAPCDAMKAETFADKAVIAAVNKSYVNVSLFLDGPNDVAKQFGIQAIPTIYLVTSTGDRVRKWEGYLGPEDYRKGLADAVVAHGKLKALEEKLKLDPDSVEVNIEAAGVYGALGRPRAAADAMKRAAGRTDDAKAKAKLWVRVLGQLYSVEVDDALNKELLAVADELEKADPSERGESLAARAQVSMNREKPYEAMTFFEEVVAKHPTCDKAAVSLLWLADLYHHVQKDNAKAKKALERILKEYSKSEVAADAKAMLQHIEAHE
jgi:thioredoxin-related protein